MHTAALRGLALGLVVLVCCAPARGRAQDALSPAPEQTPVEQTPVEQTPEQTRVEPVAPEAAPVLALSQANAEQLQVNALQLRLRDLELEREDTSTVLPWTLMIVGVAAIVLGASVGIERTVSCETSCSGEVWPGWFVLGGATFASVGLLWLKLTDEDLSELRSRHYHLQNQIDAIEQSRAPSVTPSAALRSPMLRWQAHF